MPSPNGFESNWATGMQNSPSKLKIALGDLRHGTAGRHSVLMPIGIGYIAAYAIKQFPSDIDVRLYDDPEEILHDIDHWQPNVIGLSNYCWNSELSRIVFDYAKTKIPGVICVAGGPEFPSNPEEQKKYLLERKEIDYYVYQEGEIAFSNLLRLIRTRGDKKEISETLKGIVYVNHLSGKMFLGSPLPRITILDEIPSPYLIGLMDQWFNGKYAPALETVRGCPFTCGFCWGGQSWYGRVAAFSTTRIKEELTYIAQKMKGYPFVLLSICDTNFGMYERDEEIALHLRVLYKKYRWPNAYDVTTGKMNYDRILRVASILENRMRVTCSVQTLNKNTLAVIKRRNIPLDQYKEIQREIKNRGMASIAELIIPMPEETKATFHEGIRILIDAGVESITAYTTMLLKGTLLASKEVKNEYDMVSKFRVIPRQFGEYVGQKCFEIEEVCVATKSMPFSDYLDCRGFALFSSILASEQFDFIYRLTHEIEMSFYDFMMSVYDSIKQGSYRATALYNLYLHETEQELWNSEKEIYHYFSKPHNYSKLLTGELGDNLIRKYYVMILLQCNEELMGICFNVFEKSARIKANHEYQEFLRDLRQWAALTRDLESILKPSPNAIPPLLELHYDIPKWYSTKKPRKMISHRRNKVLYSVLPQTEKVRRVLEESRRLYGENLDYQIGKILYTHSLKDIWNVCQEITSNY